MCCCILPWKIISKKILFCLTPKAQSFDQPAGVWVMWWFHIIVCLFTLMPSRQKCFAYLQFLQHCNILMTRLLYCRIPRDCTSLAILKLKNLYGSGIPISWSMNFPYPNNLQLPQVGVEAWLASHTQQTCRNK